MVLDMEYDPLTKNTFEINPSPAAIVSGEDGTKMVNALGRGKG